MIFYNRFHAPPIEGTSPYEIGKRVGQNEALVFGVVLAIGCVYLLLSDSSGAWQSGPPKKRGRASDRDSRVIAIWVVLVIAMLIGVGAYEFRRPNQPSGAAGVQPGAAQPFVQPQLPRPQPVPEAPNPFAGPAPGLPNPPAANFPPRDVRRRFAVKPPAMPLAGNNPAAIPGGFLELDPAGAAPKFPGPELLAGHLPGGKQELPQNCVPVGNETPLVPGTPVKYHFVRWTDGIVLEAPKDGGQVVIREAGLPFRKSVDREALAISADTLKSLNEPNAAGKYATAAKEARRATSHRFTHK